MKWVLLDSEDEVCPKCGARIEVLVDEEDNISQERCSLGCFSNGVSLKNLKKYNPFSYI